MPRKNIVDLHIDKTYRGISLLSRIRQDPLGYFINLGVKNGSHTWLSLMGSPVLFLNDATGVEHVSTGGYHKGKYNEALRPLLGQSIFLSEDDSWRKRRRDAAPVFSGGNFPEFVNHMTKATEAMLKRWEPLAGRGDPIEITQECMRVTLDVVLRSLFHEENEVALKGMASALGTMLRMAEERIWSVANLPLPLASALPKYTRPLKFFYEITADFIKRRKTNKAYPEDLLSRLIEARAETEEDKQYIRDDITAFITAGHETTANALIWTLYELGRHTEIRNRVIAEIDSVVGRNVPDMDMIKNLKYTKQVFNEALRLYPPVWTTSRRAVKDDLIPLDDGRQVFVPKDATVMLCSYSLQRREKYWSDPESFTPERFSLEETDKRSRWTWIPFGGGPRLCLGFRFAEVESLIILAMIYQKYNLSLIPGQQVKPQPMITLRPDRPILFRATQRTAVIEKTVPYLRVARSSESRDV